MNNVSYLLVKSSGTYLDVEETKLIKNELILHVRDDMQFRSDV